MKERALPYPDLTLFNGKIRTPARDGAVVEALADGPCSCSAIVLVYEHEPDIRLSSVEARSRITI